MRALVIDDSRAMRTILKSLLAELGFQTAEAPDGKRALEVLAAQGPFDLCMVDWNMPEMNGYEFVKAARAIRANDHTRLLMCTTETEMSQVQKALEAGANEYVMKPFTKEVVRDKLAMLGVTGFAA